MDHGILDPDGARERLAEWKGRIDKLAVDTKAMSDRLQGVQVSASDPGGLAEVTVDSTGALVDLRLTDKIAKVSPAVVARTIMATLGDAKAKLADRSQEIIADTVGAESSVGRAIAENIGRHLRGGPAPERVAPVRLDDDEDYGGHSYMQER